jgi:transposase
MSDQNLTNVSPRNYVTAQQKLLIVQESYAPNQSIAEVARKYNVGVSSLLNWRKRSNEGSLMTINKKEDLVPASEVKQLKNKIKQLQQLLGKKTMMVEILQEAIEIGREKKLISRQPFPGEEDIAKDWS